MSSSCNSLENYFHIASSFAFAKLGLLSVRHPIHVIQTNKQANPSLSNVEIIQKIYQESGIWGFYRSTGTSIAKILVTESYRGILMIRVPRAVRSFFDDSWKELYPRSTLLLTSLFAVPIISGVDATLICPFVRMATLQTTNENNSKITAIYKNYIKGSALKELYRGYVPLYIQTALSWGNFFAIDDLIKEFLKRGFKTISYFELTLSSFIGGGVQTCLNAIPDSIRVQMQKQGTHHLTARKTFEVFVRQHGFRALFQSVPHRFLSNVVSYGYKSLLRHYWTKESEN